MQSENELESTHRRDFQLRFASWLFFQGICYLPLTLFQILSGEVKEKDSISLFSNAIFTVFSLLMHFFFLPHNPSLHRPETALILTRCLLVFFSFSNSEKPVTTSQGKSLRTKVRVQDGKAFSMIIFTAFQKWSFTCFLNWLTHFLN